MTTVDASSAAIAVTKPAPAVSRPPFLVPAVCLVAIYWLGRLGVTLAYGGGFEHFMYLFWAPIVLSLAFLFWLLCFSRMAWIDRSWALAALAVSGVATFFLVDKSMKMGVFMYALPVALTALVGWLLVTRTRTGWANRLAMLTAVMAAWGYFTLIRIDGIEGSLTPEASWRWEETAEDRFLADLQPPAQNQPIELTAGAHDWPEFRGALRDGAVRGVKLIGDWDAHPPREMWRRRVGPNWSSIAVIGNYGFTQEQRNEEEAVVCFDIRTGKDAWVHLDKARFWETVAGAGPRATPTFANGKLYTQGASGLLNCLDAATGKEIWSRDVAAEAAAPAKATPPMWGFSGSPLVTAGVVVAFAGGPQAEEGKPPHEKALMAYDAETGEPRWSGGKGSFSYSSPQAWTSGGVEQVLFVSDYGLESFEAASGKPLWEHKWSEKGMFRVVQPLVTRGHGIMLGTGMAIGTRQLFVQPASDGNWEVEKGWTTKDLKPYFNDFVEHDGHLYGFDGNIFTCIELETGEATWKKGRYGDGQALLVADSGHLIVVTETTGEVVLLEANPEEHVELSRLKVLPGKTWNHPVLIGNKLIVRNGEEMACYELALEEQQPEAKGDSESGSAGEKDSL